MTLNKIYYSLFIFFLIFCSLSCKTKKRVQTSNDRLPTSVLVDQFLNSTHYNFISGKAKISFRSNQFSEKATLYLRAKKDSVLWMAGKKLSIEGVRIQVTNEDATILNRLDKTVQAVPLDTLQHLYGFQGDLSYLQAMLFGITPKIDTTGVWELNADGSELIINTVINNLHHSFVIDRRNGRLNSGTFRSKFTGTGSWTYSDYRQVKENISLPFQRKYTVNLDNGEYLSCEMKFSEMEIDVPKSIRFSIPSHYERVY